MRNIIAIFKRDLSRIRGSVVALIVAVGLVIVPTLYAWFNIAGSWDPYGNTGNLKVAVANSDDGYMSDLIPVRVNIGDTVVSALRENDQLDWRFVSESDAVEGVRSGEYYAAVVIPENFSSRMMTVFSSDAEHAEIVYYENQKANAIAPRVTDKAASTVRQQIDETFAKTISDVGLATTSSLLEFMDGDQIAAYAGNLSGTLAGAITTLRDASGSVDEFAGLLQSSTGLLDSTSDLLASAGTASKDAEALVGDAKTGLSGMHDALDAAVAAINQSLKDSAGDYDAAAKAIDEAFGAADAHVSLTVTQLRDASADMAKRASDIRDVQDNILAVERDVEGSNLPEKLKAELVQKIDIVANTVGNVANQQELLAKHLSDAAASLETGAADARAKAQAVKDGIAEAKGSIGGVKDSYNATLKQQISDLSDAVADVARRGSDMADDLGATVTDLSHAASALSGDLAGAHEVLAGASADLVSAADDLQRLKEGLDTAVTSGDLDRVRELIGSDPAALADALAAPVALDRQAVYHIKNYGSAMAPFYTTLSIWVAGIVLAAMLKANVDEADVKALGNPRLHEIYLGRYAFFALLAFAQATLVCAGDLLFFGIQCEHPFQFMLVGWLAGFVFSNMIYTLTVSFGDIGKAIAVVLLVMQVAGSGGTFPIEMTADFFQAVYPFLPFTHAINAMHAAMAGAYGMEFWIELGTLSLYLIPSLALGLVFRRPVIRANRWIIEKLEETKLM
ncbi:YhgE/Pip domain protein [Collinsella intestinalis DSM 13280]|uniref:YhgE/Pip domain protein n=1 Tax=Collinsella intestinalis DSM 13280 TaxID=521003 RepID=C4FBL8_9ACTN|nr:YhgE/Pip domain-containing protein [Collinsella intestinalis]EEP43770.1 YhgE/Pip domain protein [Collinsella intestinalis DSM 13280]